MSHSKCSAPSHIIFQFVTDFMLINSILPVLHGVLSNFFPAEKFLNAVIQSGNRGYDALCRVVKENPDNRFARIVEVLDIANETNNALPAAATGNGGVARPSNTGNVLPASMYHSSTDINCISIMTVWSFKYSNVHMFYTRINYIGMWKLFSKQHQRSI